MLVLTRRKGDTVKIGDDIEVTVVDVEDGSVRLGIKAPKTTVILRGELYSAVETENRRALSDARNIDLFKTKQKENKPTSQDK